ncbi:MAG: hypothetical protein ABIL49_07920 [candidate division WOR-3 bacterium]
MVRKITIEEIYSNIETFQKLSNDDFILSPYFQIPLYDILKDELCEFYGYFYENKLVGISALQIDENYYRFPTYENVNPYQDFIVDNRFRKQFISEILKDKHFVLFPILDESPSVKILFEQFNVQKQEFSKIYYLELPKMLEEMIYKSKKRDELVKILKKYSKSYNFVRVENFDFYELLIKTKMYLLPQKLQIFVSDLISICKTNNFLKLFTIDNEFYFIVFAYKSKAYLWHYELEDENLKIYGFLKLLENLIFENFKTLYIFTDILDINFPIKSRTTYKIYNL